MIARAPSFRFRPAPRRSLVGLGEGWDMPSWESGTGPMLDQHDLYAAQCPSAMKWDDAKRGCVSIVDTGSQEVVCPRGMERNTDESRGPIGCVPTLGQSNGKQSNGKQSNMTAEMIAGVSVGVMALGVIGFVSLYLWENR